LALKAIFGAPVEGKEKAGHAIDSAMELMRAHGILQKSKRAILNECARFDCLKVSPEVWPEGKHCYGIFSEP
jgi:hypothetical protein